MRSVISQIRDLKPMARVAYEYLQAIDACIDSPVKIVPIRTDWVVFIKNDYYF